MLTESSVDVDVWPLGEGRWCADRRDADFVLTPQPFTKNDRASRLLREAGAKRLRYGFFARIRVVTDEYGRFKPVLLKWEAK